MRKTAAVKATIIMDMIRAYFMHFTKSIKNNFSLFNESPYFSYYVSIKGNKMQYKDRTVIAE